MYFPTRNGRTDFLYNIGMGTLFASRRTRRTAEEKAANFVHLDNIGNGNIYMFSHQFDAAERLRRETAVAGFLGAPYSFAMEKDFVMGIRALDLI